MILNNYSQISKLNKYCYCTKIAVKNKYSHTVVLPKTKFPLRLENKKLVQRDEFINTTADFENYYSWQRSHLSEPEFVLHDGPLYANGQLHIGHAINRILKDAILRHHVLNGNKVNFVPGWDCHGLPIELKALSGFVTDPLEVRRRSREFAKKSIEEQKQMFVSWGDLGDWKNYYTTYSKDYVKVQLKQFLKLYEKNYVYRDIKPVFWSPSSKTALAEAELEYNESHKSTSLFVRFEIKNIPKLNIGKEKSVYALIWTTTPWTLPANSAVCYNELLSYSVVTKSESSDHPIYIIATDLLQNLCSVLNCKFDVLKVIPGDALKDAIYVHPVYKNTLNSFVHGSHVQATKGTGLVHTAPAHGADDFIISIKNKIPRVDIVNEMGNYTIDAGLKLQGKPVLTDGNKTVLEMIENDIVHLSELIHSYPYDWRTKQPVIIRASHQWFIDTESIKNRAVDLLESVEIIPKDRSEIYKKDFTNQIQKRPYWCISRQRKWGVPIPVFYNNDMSEIIINENTINHYCNLLERHGPDFWWKLSTQELLPERLYSAAGNSLERCQDIMDIWLDSGLSWAKVLDGTKVADMYLEGIDQIRGWFQSSLLTSVALRDKVPFKKLYIHGFAVDEKGNKMSKSLGNVIDPTDIIKGRNGQKAYGIDTLRWWVTCHANRDPQANVSANVLQSSAEEVQKIRSVLRFALGGLSDYKKLDDDQNNLLLIDRYILHLLYHFYTEVTEHMLNYQFHKVSYNVINLVTNPISALYYTSIKDRLYCEFADSPSRRAAQYTLLQIFETITQVIAPMVPHLAEEMYLYFPQKESKTYFTRIPPKPQEFWENEEVEKVMGTILSCRRDVNKELGANTSGAEVSLLFPNKTLETLQSFAKLDDIEHQLADIFQVAKVTISKEQINEEYKLYITSVNRFPCPRCKKVHSENEDSLCLRCHVVVNVLTENKTSVSN